MQQIHDGGRYGIGERIISGEKWRSYAVLKIALAASLLLLD